MAHDLRSPLTSILFLADVLQRGENGPVNDAQRRALGLMYSAALSLCTAASDVLELARGGNRLVDQRPASFSTAEMFASVRDMVLPLAVEKGLEVRLVHPVPERRVGYPRALSRVLLNLATNAVKYTDAGFVEIAARPTGRTRLEFSVRDTGDGFDPDRVRTLYQPFRKAQAREGDGRDAAGGDRPARHALLVRARAAAARGVLATHRPSDPAAARRRPERATHRLHAD